MNKKLKSIFSFLIIFLFYFFLLGFLFFPSPIFAICCKCESTAVTGGQEQSGTNCENVNIDKCSDLDQSASAPGVYTSKKCTLIDCSDPLCPAAEVEPTAIRQEIKESVPILNIKIGGTLIQFDPVKCGPGEVCPISWLAQYINVLFKYLIGIAAILSAVVILFGGFVWLTSFGSPEKVKQAKDYIIGAMTGLFLALFSYLILFTINPNLVNFNPINLKVVKPLIAEGFGPGASSEGSGGTGSQSIGPGGGDGSGTVSNTGLTDYTVQKISEYEAHGCEVTGRWRPDGAGTRHQSGYAVDFAYTVGDSCYNYITQNAQTTVDEARSWWHEYYIMPDGSVWVHENNAVTGGSGPHWHVEFPDPNGNWEWREAR